MRNILIYAAVVLLGALWFMRRGANRGRKN
jgi:hypothetical protein